MFGGDSSRLPWTPAWCCSWEWLRLAHSAQKDVYAICMDWLAVPGQGETCWSSPLRDVFQSLIFFQPPTPICWNGDFSPDLFFFLIGCLSVRSDCTERTLYLDQAGLCLPKDSLTHMARQEGRTCALPSGGWATPSHHPAPATAFSWAAGRRGVSSAHSDGKAATSLLAQFDPESSLLLLHMVLMACGVFLL